MSLNNIQLGAQQLVALYGDLLVEKPAGVTTLQEKDLTKGPIVMSDEPAPTVQLDAVKAIPEPEVTPEEETSEKPFIRSLGGNARRILIVVQREKEAFLPDGELKFLTNILSACGLSIADIALVNLHVVEDKSYGSLTEHFSSKQVLLFDVTPGELGMPINFPPFQVQAFKKIRYMHAPALHLIEADVAQKKELWTALKNLFQL